MSYVHVIIMADMEVACPCKKQKTVCVSDTVIKPTNQPEYCCQVRMEITQHMMKICINVNSLKCTYKCMHTDMCRTGCIYICIHVCIFALLILNNTFDKKLQ